MCSPSQRADALNAVTLIENVARLATQGLFGFVFASLAEIGKAYATFFVNAVRVSIHIINVQLGSKEEETLPNLLVIQRVDSDENHGSSIPQ